MTRTKTTKTVSAREAVECIRGPMTNAEVMARFGVNTTGFADLLTQLLLNKLITQEDLGRRGIRFRTRKKKEPARRIAPVDSCSKEDLETVLDISVMTEVLALKPLPEPPSGRDDVMLDTAVLMHMLTDKPAIPARVPVRKVRILFREEAARLVRGRMWHPTQEIEEENDGSLTVSLNVPIDPDVISWILGFGSGALVLEPPSLRQRVKAELEATLRCYRTGSYTNGKAEKVMPQPRQLQTGDEDEIDLWKLDRK